MSINQFNLIREVEFFHRQFFRCDASITFIEYYIKAHEEQPDLACASASELRTVRVIIEKELNAFGIEPWLRLGSERHLLSRKLLLLAYLAECDAGHLTFRQEVKGALCSFVQLCRSAVLGVIQLLNGRFQIALYELI